MCAHLAGSRHRPCLAGSISQGLNHSILTGTLIGDPRRGRNPVGDPTTLLRVEFPVVDPEHPQVLREWASCEVEVADGLIERRAIRELRAGTRILAAGQLGERWMTSDGRAGRGAVIVANLVHQPPPEVNELILPGCPPRTGCQAD